MRRSRYYRINVDNGVPLICCPLTVSLFKRDLTAVEIQASYLANEAMVPSRMPSSKSRLCPMRELETATAPEYSKSDSLSVDTAFSPLRRKELQLWLLKCFKHENQLCLSSTKYNSPHRFQQRWTELLSLQGQHPSFWQLHLSMMQRGIATLTFALRLI